MTFWDFAVKAFDWFAGRSTRLLGIAQGTLAVIAAQDDLLSKRQTSMILAGIAVLTYWRGQATNTTYLQARAVLQANPTQTEK